MGPSPRALVAQIRSRPEILDGASKEIDRMETIGGGVRPPSAAAQAAVERLLNAVSEALVGKPEVVRLALTALVGRGHLLVEDVPGVGKTTLAAALARAVGGRFSRIQFTSDLLPSDIIGVSVFDSRERRFEFRPGPLFANVVLADEINRTTPKTQSALLEAMSERRVSVDGVTRILPEPFFVVATQNPVEHHGTFPLPDSQMDRFLMRIRIGYPSAEDETAILAGEGRTDPDGEASPVIDANGLAALQQAAERIRTVPAVLDYMVALSRATRALPGVAIGVSPRGSLALLRASRAWALLEGREFVSPDNVKRMALPVLSHRLVMEGAEDGVDREAAEQALREVLDTVPVPR
jgi:MoxR-like ATPase